MAEKMAYKESTPDSADNDTHRSSSQQPARNPDWTVQASKGALKTCNPIREIIETMNLAENPDKKLIPLSIGDPTIFGNMKPCQEILDALQRANSCGKHYGYQKAAGMESAREAVAEYHYRCTGNRINPQDVILASGCSHAIDMSICVLAGPGQNILIPRPGFPLYKTLTSVYGVQYKQYNLIAEQNWAIDLEHLESLIDQNTAAIVINNPSNPCGSVFTRKHLIQILDLAERYRKPIISDEIYDKFVFSPEQYSINTRQLKTRKQTRWHTNNNTQLANHHVWDEAHYNHSSPADHDSLETTTDSYRYDNGLNTSWNDTDQLDSDLGSGDDGASSSFLDACQFGYVPFRALSSLTDRVPILTCGGISKTCLIPGVRLGWIIINDRQSIFDSSVRDGLSRLSQRLMGPNSLAQGALPDILTKVPEAFYSQTMEFIYKNAKLSYDRMSSIVGLTPHMPQGSMYLMARFEPESLPDIDGDLDFTSKLVNEESVLVLPGSCFDFPNYFRVCLTVPRDVLIEALDRIESFCERHHRESIDDQSAVGRLAINLASADSPTAKPIRDAQLLKSINLMSNHTINGHRVGEC